MNITGTNELTFQQKEDIFRLWNGEYPEKIQFKTVLHLENYLYGLTGQEHFFLTNYANCVAGWAATFTRDGEKWFAMILDKKIHGMGYGTFLLNRLKEKQIKLNGWVIDHDRDAKQNGEPYVSPVNFYLKNGFIVCPDTRLENNISAVKIEWSK